MTNDHTKNLKIDIEFPRGTIDDSEGIPVYISSPGEAITLVCMEISTDFNWKANQLVAIRRSSDPSTIVHKIERVETLTAERCRLWLSPITQKWP